MTKANVKEVAMREAVIVSSVRTAVGKAGKGTLRRDPARRHGRRRHRGPPWRAYPRSSPRLVDDVILGCAMPEAEQGMNVARLASLLAGLPYTAGAMTINRFCSSGLQAIALAAQAIADRRGRRGRRRRHRVHEPRARWAATRSRPTPRCSSAIPTATSAWASPPSGWPQKYGIDRERSDAFALALAPARRSPPSRPASSRTRSSPLDRERQRQRPDR